MLSFDTNLAVYAANSRDPRHKTPWEFLSNLKADTNVAVCQLMLVEFFLKLCNARI